MKPAVFFDRDGTLIESVHYLSRPEQVRLLPGAGETLAGLRAAGWATILVTNQAGIGKGLFSEEDLCQVHEVLFKKLAAAGGHLDGWYHSAQVQRGSDREVVEHPDRKPGPGMLQRAAAAHDLELGRSWMVGDAVTDVLAGRNAGCKATVLVRSGLATERCLAHPAVDHVIKSVADLLELMSHHESMEGTL